MNALAGRYPRLATALPSRPLGTWPTAIDEAHALGGEFDAPALWLKRDDTCNGIYGGNKVRKLEYLLGDALGRGCDAVLTFGAVGSNHALATAIHARQFGLDCHAVLTPQPVTPYVADTLRYHALLGTRLHPAGSYADVLALAATIRDQHPSGAERLCQVPWGGSSWLGTAGFVAAGLELAAQVARGELPSPDRIYLPCGTMGSVAGLALGLEVAGLRAVVVAVKVVPQSATNAAATATLVATTARELQQRDPSFPAPAGAATLIEFRDEFVGAGYAMPTPASLEAVTLARAHGYRLENTYSGKAFACLVADARSGGLAGRSALFWLTCNSRPYPPAIASVTADDLSLPLRQYL